MTEHKNSTENLKICVRIRPLTAEEATKKYSRALQSIDKKMIVLYEQVSEKLDALREKRKKEHKFAYDRVFSEDSTQSEVYGETTKDLIPFVLEGFNATVFAYGPTGTGKTYTMVGTAKQPGIMVMALNDLFTLMKKGDEKFQVSMSYLEIYNERIRDLLVSNPKNLELWENPRTGVIQVTDLSQVSTTSTSEVMKLLQKGNDRRSCESTAANRTSSRSHALLQINVRLSSHDHSVGEEVKTGRLFMVDLAGSERARRTQNVGMRLQEGASINKSLLALGNVINALAEGGAKFVNFRDSKLTRLLKDALTGNCKTVMIAHVSPANVHREESRNTLIYADKAKKISTKTRQNKIDVSYHVSQYQAIISELKGEIRRLKSKLDDDKLDNSGKGKTKPKDNKKIEALKSELIETFNEQMALRKKLMEIDNSIVAMAIEFEKQSQVIQEYENEKKSKKKGRRTSDENSDPEDDDDDDEDDPEEIMEAWEDLVYIHNEQNRYTEMKAAINAELQEKKIRSKEIEESLPKQTNNYEQRELLALLCKVHELEIQQVEMARNAIMKEHDLYRRDLLLMRYDRQRSLCEEIITKQRSMLSESSHSYNQELEELYALYQLETQYTNNLKSSNSLGDLGHLRSNSVLSLRPDKLPPLTSKEPEKLFRPGRRRNSSDDRRPGTPLSISSPLGSPQINPTGTPSSLPSNVVLPPIRGTRTTNFLSLQEQKHGPPRGATPTPLPPALKKIKRIHPLHKPSSLEDIVLLDSPRMNKKEKERRNKNLNWKPRRSDSFSGLVKPNLKSTNRPKSDGSSNSIPKLGDDFPSSLKASFDLPLPLRGGGDLPSPMRRGRQLRKEKNVVRRRGHSLGRVHDGRRGELKPSATPGELFLSNKPYKPFSNDSYVYMRPLT